MSERGFWGKLPTPFFVLAPMADVTDASFRRVIAKYGKPDVMYTEFVSCDGLQSAGRERLLRDLLYTEPERPIVAQIFGAKPENFEKTAALVRELGFDGVDINMGCPDRSLVKSGSCGGLIGNPKLAKEIIEATKRGAGHLPVSVKTRIGKQKIITEEWIGALAEANPAVITVHGRTVKEMSKVPAHWDEIGKAARVCREKGILCIGNGDVMTLDDARIKAAEFGVDGVMLGRAIFGNPFLFNESIENPTLTEKLAILLEHAELYEQLLGDVKNFAIMRKHFGSYIKGFDGAKDLRMKLMSCENAGEMRKIIEHPESW
ncbi:MAG: tRNA-dihydrouridine synthase [Patescibacteria group bacterium]